MRIIFSLFLAIIITFIAWKEMKGFSVRAMFFLGQFSIFFNWLDDFGIK